MNDLRDLLISRITDIQLLMENKTIKVTQTLSQNPEHSRTNQISTYSPKKKIQQQNSRSFVSNCNFLANRHSIIDSPCDAVENQSLKSSSKFSFLVRKKEKFRNTKEIKILLALNLSTFVHHKQIQQIFQAYDSQFTKYKNQGSFLSVSMQQNLKKIYSFFFLKHDEEQSSRQFILQVSKLQIFDLSPSFFLGWIKKWSSRLLHFHLNLNEDNNELNIGAKLDMQKIKDKILNKNLNFDIFSKKHRSNSFNFISQNKSFPQPSNKHQKQPSKILVEKSFDTKIKKILLSLQSNESSTSMTINSKQMVYSFCLDQIKGYYKNLPIEDLDYGYLRNMKKMGKKEQIIVGQNSKNAIKVLLESKNSSIKVLTAKFKSEYQKFRSGKSPIFIKESLNRKPQLKQQLQQKFGADENKNINLDILIDSPMKSLSMIPSLNSKLLTPSIKSREVYKKRSKQDEKKEDEVQLLLNQKINSYKRNSQQLSSNNNEFKSQIINYNKLLGWQLTEESIEIQDQRNCPKEISKKKGDQQSGEKENYQKDLTDEENNFPTETQNLSTNPLQSYRQNVSRLPKLFAQHKLKKLRGKRHQSSSKDRINRSEIVSSLNRQLHLKQQINTDQINDIFSKKRIELQHSPYSKMHVQNLNKRLSSQTSEKQTLINPSDRENQRSLSNFQMKSKFGIPYQKESYNVIKYNKNKTAFKDSLPDLEIIKTVKNKLQDKNPFKHSNNISKGISHSVKNNIFAGEMISFQSQDKDQFVQYLKNLHSEKIQNHIFQKEQQKQKQKQIKKKLP